MLSYSVIMVTFAMFSGLISGLPNMSQLDIRSDSISQSNRMPLLARTTWTPGQRSENLPLYSRLRVSDHSQHQRNNNRAKGLKCDRTFYDEGNIEAFVHASCRGSHTLSDVVPPTNVPPKMFLGQRRLFPNPKLFQSQLSSEPSSEQLTMLPLTEVFFNRRYNLVSHNTKNHYMVFSNPCESVGIVRQLMNGDYALCESINDYSGRFYSEFRETVDLLELTQARMY
ncbi:hypothetical protein OnM2_091042 [Erysiphe neolycopersici]|uniref:Uncharacterized protein n=1 Tax=Erysiphe neolycopersici TaxID=212602 RepID=A0A420HCN6_9PEZI|nr:hypothetical protein OnM2_091042 [Erysiphe neolycopersici]